MGKRGYAGALLKRPASNVASIQGALLSDADLTRLKATRNIDDFRKLARDLGLVTRRQGRHVAKEDILDECRRRLCDPSTFASGHVEGRDAIRARAAELGVKRYKEKVKGSSRSTWRSTAELQAEIIKAEAREKKPLLSLFERQRQNQQVPGTEPNHVSVS